MFSPVAAEAPVVAATDWLFELNVARVPVELVPFSPVRLALKNALMISSSIARPIAHAPAIAYELVGSISMRSLS